MSIRVQVNFYHLDLDSPCFPNLILNANTTRELVLKIQSRLCGILLNDDFLLFDKNGKLLRLDTYPVPSQVNVVFIPESFSLPKKETSKWIHVQLKQGEKACPKMCYERKRVPEEIASDLGLDRDLILVSHDTGEILDPTRPLPQHWKSLIALWEKLGKKQATETKITKTARARHIIEAQQQYWAQTKIKTHTENYLRGDQHFDWFMFPLTAPDGWSRTSQEFSIVDRKTRDSLLSDPIWVQTYLQTLQNFAEAYDKNPDAVLDYPIRVYKLLMSLGQFLDYTKTNHHLELFTHLCKIARRYDYIWKAPYIKSLEVIDQAGTSKLRKFFQSCSK